MGEYGVTKNGFVLKRFDAVYESLAEKVKDHKITIAPGRHEYSAWLQDEMKRGR